MRIGNPSLAFVVALVTLAVHCVPLPKTIPLRFKTQGLELHCCSSGHLAQ